MIPAGFDYEVAESVDHALELLRTKEDAKLLAGGHSLLPLMKLRLARPGRWWTSAASRASPGCSDGGAHLAIGALTRHHDLNNDATAKEHCPLIATRRGWWATRRCATAAPSADRSRTATRRPTCPPSASPSTR